MGFVRKSPDILSVRCLLIGKVRFFLLQFYIRKVEVISPNDLPFVLCFDFHCGHCVPDLAHVTKISTNNFCKTKISASPSVVAYCRQEWMPALRLVLLDIMKNFGSFDEIGESSVYHRLDFFKMWIKIVKRTDRPTMDKNLQQTVKNLKNSKEPPKKGHSQLDQFLDWKCFSAD